MLVSKFCYKTQMFLNQNAFSTVLSIRVGSKKFVLFSVCLEQWFFNPAWDSIRGSLVIIDSRNVIDPQS